MQLSSGSLCVCSAGSSTRESPVLSVVSEQCLCSVLWEGLRDCFGDLPLVSTLNCNDIVLR